MSSNWKLCWKWMTSIHGLIPILTAILIFSFCGGRNDHQLLEVDYKSNKRMFENITLTSHALEEPFLKKYQAPWHHQNTTVIYVSLIHIKLWNTIHAAYFFIEWNQNIRKHSQETIRLSSIYHIPSQLESISHHQIRWYLTIDWIEMYPSPFLSPNFCANILDERYEVK